MIRFRGFKDIEVHFLELIIILVEVNFQLEDSSNCYTTILVNDDFIVYRNILCIACWVFSKNVMIGCNNVILKLF